MAGAAAKIWMFLTYSVPARRSHAPGLQRALAAAVRKCGRAPLRRRPLLSLSGGRGDCRRGRASRHACARAGADDRRLGGDFRRDGGGDPFCLRPRQLPLVPAAAMPIAPRGCRRCRCWRRCAIRASSPSWRSGSASTSSSGLARLRSWPQSQSVAWQAHIGGFLAGLLLFSLFDPIPPAPRDVARCFDRHDRPAVSSTRLDLLARTVAVIYIIAKNQQTTLRCFLFRQEDRPRVVEGLGERGRLDFDGGDNDRSCDTRCQGPSGREHRSGCESFIRGEALSERRIGALLVHGRRQDRGHHFRARYRSRAGRTRCRRFSTSRSAP